MGRKVRKFLTKIILPKRDLDSIIVNRPEQETSIGAFLIKHFTAVLKSDQLNQLAQKLVFVLCKENKDRFMNRVGYGNAAGFLMNLGGGLGLAPGEASGEYSTDSEEGEEVEAPVVSDEN